MLIFPLVTTGVRFPLALARPAGYRCPALATLFVTDLDGTLIRDDLTLSSEARADLCALLAEGAPITVASARSVTSIRAILGEIPFALPIVEFNGAFLSEYRTGRHEIVNAIPAPIARGLFEAMRAEGCTPYVSAFDGERDRVFYDTIANEGMAAYFAERVAFKDERLQRVDDLAATLDGGTVCLTCIERAGRIDALHASLASAFGGRGGAHQLRLPLLPRLEVLHRARPPVDQGPGHRRPAVIARAWKSTSSSCSATT